MKKSVLTVAISLASVVAQARESHGVRMPDTVNIAGKQVKINGMGLRKKLFFDVYVAGFYVESPSKDPSELISSDQIKRITMYMLRDLSKEKIGEAMREGFEKNSKEQMPALQDRLERLISILPDAKRGSTIVITYIPGTGTTLSALGERSVIEGKDFADALFSVWLGKDPVDGNLKKSLVGAD